MKSLLILLSLAMTAIAGEITRPSGRPIKVLAVGEMIFTSSLPSAWVLQYETSHSFAEKNEIIAEVEDIWTTFCLEVEKREMKLGIIKVASPEGGSVIKRRTELYFVFESKEDGTWSMQLPDLLREVKN